MTSNKKDQKIGSGKNNKQSTNNRSEILEFKFEYAPTFSLQTDQISENQIPKKGPWAENQHFNQMKSLSVI